MCFNDTNTTTFVITDTKLNVPDVTLSTQDNAKLLEQLKSGFERTIKWNKYQTKVSVQAPNLYLDFLVDPRFQGVKKLFVLSLENKDNRTLHTKYNLPTVEIKDYKIMIDGRNFSDQPNKKNLKTYDTIGKFKTGQGDDYTTGCLLDYNCFNNYYKMIALDLSKQQVIDAHPKATQQINFTGNLNPGENVNDNVIVFFIIKEAK